MATLRVREYDLKTEGGECKLYLDVIVPGPMKAPPSRIIIPLPDGGMDTFSLNWIVSQLRGSEGEATTASEHHRLTIKYRKHYTRSRTYIEMLVSIHPAPEHVILMLNMRGGVVYDVYSPASCEFIDFEVQEEQKTGEEWRETETTRDLVQVETNTTYIVLPGGLRVPVDSYSRIVRLVKREIKKFMLEGVVFFPDIRIGYVSIRERGWRERTARGIEVRGEAYIEGHTYPVKDVIKKHGFRWSTDKWVLMVTEAIEKPELKQPFERYTIDIVPRDMIERVVNKTIEATAAAFRDAVAKAREMFGHGYAVLAIVSLRPGEIPDLDVVREIVEKAVERIGGFREIKSIEEVNEINRKLDGLSGIPLKTRYVIEEEW